MVLVFAEHNGGVFKKAAFEAVTYARQSADNIGSSVTAVVFEGASDPGVLGKYGADKVVSINLPESAMADSKLASEGIAEVAENMGANVVVFNHSSFGKSVAGRLGVRLKAGLVSGAIGVANGQTGSLKVRKSVFSGKAFATYEITTPRAVITVMPNALPVVESGAEVSVEQIAVSNTSSNIEVVSTQKQTGIVPLPEAELVVSAGRGMKDPSNWGIVEELASILGATTACSRPVADADWRPHHEHVGQTGIAIRPNLYIAIGISGAIQHLAGVNNSKVIVVINKDPEAPFFKAADYGVCADLFDVVPRLNEALKKFKSQ